MERLEVRAGWRERTQNECEQRTRRGTECDEKRTGRVEEWFVPAGLNSKS